jgi:hypothetical protein
VEFRKERKSPGSRGMGSYGELRKVMSADSEGPAGDAYEDGWEPSVSDRDGVETLDSGNHESYSEELKSGKKAGIGGMLQWNDGAGGQPTTEYVAAMSNGALGMVGSTLGNRLRELAVVCSLLKSASNHCESATVCVALR